MLVVAVFYGGLLAASLMPALATFLLSLALRKRGDRAFDAPGATDHWIERTRMALPRFTSPALGLLALACGGVSDSSQNSTLNVAFYGFAPTLNGTEAVLWLEGVGRLPYALPAEHTATESAPLPFATLSLSSTDSVHAEAILYSAAQVELARVSTGFRVEARFRYGIGFQAGGRNPDLRGFCHHPPHVLAIPGFPGDSLYLWTSGLPVGAVC